MDKTDKPKSVREVLEELYKRAIIGYPLDDKRDEERAIEEAKQSIRELLPIKRHHNASANRAYYETDGDQGYNQAISEMEER